MKVVLVPGPRNEELIALVKEAMMRWDGEDYDEFYALCSRYGRSEVFDALYYACKDGEKMLDDQAQYMNYCLFHEEDEYYIRRMLGKGPLW